MSLRQAAVAATALVAGIVVAGTPAGARADSDPSGASASSSASPSVAQRMRAAGLASTIKLSSCSASLVRYPSSKSTDRAMMLTNGHCYEGGFLDAGEVLLDQPSRRSGQLLDADGRILGTVRADRILYATMTGTDVTLYRLTDTFAGIRSRYAARALTIAARHPAAGASISIPTSYFAKVYSCRIDGFVDTLRESQWTWHDSIRYEFPDDSCRTIHGTSGSPVIDDSSLKLVGINNTGNDDGEACTLDNPCEVGADGSVTETKGQNYGQETYWLTTCLTSANVIDLDKTGCLLAAPAARVRAPSSSGAATTPR